MNKLIDAGNIWLAITNGTKEQLDALLKKFDVAKIDESVSPHGTLLGTAIKSGSLEKTRMLLDAGADPNAISRNITRHPIGLVREEFTPLGVAAFGHVRAVNMNQDAAIPIYFNIMKLLLERGADKTIQNYAELPDGILEGTALEIILTSIGELPEDVAELLQPPPPPGNPEDFVPPPPDLPQD